VLATKLGGFGDLNAENEPNRAASAIGMTSASVAVALRALRILQAMM